MIIKDAEKVLNELRNCTIEGFDYEIVVDIKKIESIFHWYMEDEEEYDGVVN